MSGQIVEKIVSRLFWLFTPKEVKEVYYGIANAMKREACQATTNKRPKEIHEIETWELMRCPKFTYRIDKYTISGFILPYGCMALLFRKGRVIALTYGKYRYVNTEA